MAAVHRTNIVGSPVVLSGAAFASLAPPVAGTFPVLADVYSLGRPVSPSPARRIAPSIFDDAAFRELVSLGRSSMPDSGAGCVPDIKYPDTDLYELFELKGPVSETGIKGLFNPRHAFKVLLRRYGHDVRAERKLRQAFKILTRADLRKTYDAIRRGGFSIPIQPGFEHRPIADDPRFKIWFASTDNPDAHFALDIARKITWAQANYLSGRGGIQLFQLNSKCPHGCSACEIMGDNSRPLKRMEWTDLYATVHGLCALECAHSDITGTAIRLINREIVYLFLDSDSLNILLPDGLMPDGRMNNRTIYDAVTLICELVKPANIIVQSSGWSSKSEVLNEAVIETIRYLAEKCKTENAPQPYVVFNLKLLTREFRKFFEGFVTRILLADPEFRTRYAQCISCKSIDFESLLQSPEAVEMYYKIVLDHLEELVGCHYLNGRADNIKKLLQVKDADFIYIHLYHADHDNIPPRYRFLSPLLSIEGLRRFKSAFDKKYGDLLPENNTNEIGWRFLPDRKFNQDDRSHPLFEDCFALLQSGVLLACGCDLSSMTQDKSAHVRSLADRPIFDFGERKPIWQISAERVLDRRFTDELPRHVRRSIKMSVRRSGIQGTQIRVADEGHVVQVGAVKVPVVDVAIGGAALWFNLLDGKLYEQILP